MAVVAVKKLPAAQLPAVAIDTPFFAHPQPCDIAERQQQYHKDKIDKSVFHTVILLLADGSLNTIRQADEVPPPCALSADRPWYFRWK